MKKFRVKLTFIFVALTALTVIAFGIFTVHNLRANHVETLRENMLQQLTLITATVPWPRELTVEEQIDYFEEQAASLRPITDSRVTFIAQDGTVLGDSDYEANQMDSHLEREEVREAMEAGGVGFSIRYSDTVKRDILNVAIAMEVDGERVGFVRLGKGLAQVDAAVRKLWMVYLTGLFLLFLVSALISYFVTRSLTRPLEHITRVAEHITNANYNYRVRIRNRDEIGKLGEAINTMADSLRSQMARITENENRLQTVLESLVSGVIMIDRYGRIVLMNRTAEQILGLAQKEAIGKRYAEAKLQQFELIDMIVACEQNHERIRDEMTFHYPEERTVEINIVPLDTQQDEWGIGMVIVLHDITAIRKLERMRSEFAANVSHELKTPIASVKGFAETLLAGALQDKETAESFVQIIYDESERLHRLIIDILELSSIESKQEPFDLSPVEMHNFVAKTLRMLRTEADNKQITLQMNVNEGIYVEADEDRLRQVLINLLSNAIHYTANGGKVTVAVIPLQLSEDPEQDRIRITVTDTGMGIPQKDLPRIFERFYRVDKARSRRSGGTGLGLSIVKHIVELHRGEISVESEPGAGTTFTIELPVIQ